MIGNFGRRAEGAGERGRKEPCAEHTSVGGGVGKASVHCFSCARRQDRREELWQHRCNRTLAWGGRAGGLGMWALLVGRVARLQGFWCQGVFFARAERLARLDREV